MAFLGFDGQGCDWAGVEALQADWFAGVFAEPVAAVVDARDGGVDLGNQFAQPVAGPQFRGAVGFRCGAVGDVGVLR